MGIKTKSTGSPAFHDLGPYSQANRDNEHAGSLEGTKEA